MILSSDFFKHTADMAFANELQSPEKIYQPIKLKEFENPGMEGMNSNL